jgi:predicted Holliday junction resolvase-like endonuclease
VLENDIHSVAKKGVVTTEEIERMLKDASKEFLEREKRQAEDLIKQAESSEQKAVQEKTLEGLKKSKYVLLKNESDLDEF